jgi:hypothetical protein
MNDKPLIWAMAKAHYEASTDYNASPAGGFTRWARWDELPQGTKDEYYDAMWAALKALRVPSEEMVEASWTATARHSAAVRMQYELMNNKEAHKLKAADRFTAMIDKLLEIK